MSAEQIIQATIHGLNEPSAAAEKPLELKELHAADAVRKALDQAEAQASVAQNAPRGRGTACASLSLGVPVPRCRLYSIGVSAE